MINCYLELLRIRFAWISKSFLQNILIQGRATRWSGAVLSTSGASNDTPRNFTTPAALARIGRATATTADTILSRASTGPFN